ncbi:Mob1/phocein [Gorgonomyces haynaldii]|nr:Mob1/phocein [Gorgonomyces haynaldii]
MNLFAGLSASKTFKPKKNIPDGTKQAQLRQVAEVTLESGNLQLAVQLPEGEDKDEWLAVNTVDFFNQVNLLYGTVTDVCTPTTCPIMNAGPKYEYYWCDGVQFKKPIKVSAPEYVDYLMTWVQLQLDDEAIFPTKLGVAFSKDFQNVVKTIFKRLFRVYAHLYLIHFQRFEELGVQAHLNTSFKHFILFVQHFKLIPSKELAPMDKVIQDINASYSQP